jgi:lysine 6-dehydrogenase
LILGAGRQGSAAAYDLARFGEAESIVLADAHLNVAEKSAERVNRLLGQAVVSGIALDVTDKQALQDALQAVHAAISAVPYQYNLDITRAAIAARTHLCDLGGNTQVVLSQLALDEAARQAGISIVPDCGMGPGLNNTLGAYAIELLDQPHEIRLFDAGLPQQPQPPWNYQLTFNINGLTNEMDGEAVYLREGKITYVPTLSEPEFIEFPPLGLLEADVTSGGTSTAPWTYQGILQRYEVKTLRYPGHFEWLRAYKALGLFSEQPLPVDGKSVIPRQVFHTLLEPQITTLPVHDVAIIRAEGKGIKDQRPTKVIIDLIDYYDPQSGFTAMERLTGWHCAIMLGFAVRGQIPPGVIPVEKALPASVFMEEVRKRGIHFQVRYQPDA